MNSCGRAEKEEGKTQNWNWTRRNEKTIERHGNFRYKPIRELKQRMKEREMNRKRHRDLRYVRIQELKQKGSKRKEGMGKGWKFKIRAYSGLIKRKVDRERKE